MELYNYTDGVSVVQLTSTSQTPEIAVSATLTVPGDLPNSQKLYVIRLKRTDGTAADYVTCKKAALQVTYS